MSQTVIWQRLSQTGLEYCTVRENRYGWEASGKVILTGDPPLLAEYWIGCDKQGLTRRVYVTVTQGEESSVLVMLMGEGGLWKINGQERPDLDGCPDVDLSVTPLTNSLPIRRLRLSEGGSSEVCAAWVSFPDLTVEPLHQRYTRLSAHRYRYESLDSDFAAELEVDPEGLMIRYGDDWQRVSDTRMKND